MGQAYPNILQRPQRRHRNPAGSQPAGAATDLNQSRSLDP